MCIRLDSVTLIMYKKATYPDTLLHNMVTDNVTECIIMKQFKK
jgi:hypothetical protein